MSARNVHVCCFIVHIHDTYAAQQHRGLCTSVHSLTHHSNVNIYTKNMHTTFMYIILSVLCMRESEISRSVIIVVVYLSLYVDLCLSINQ